MNVTFLSLSRLIIVKGSMAKTEAELIQNFQTGRRDAFGPLYDAYIKKIYDFIYYKIHHRETAEDLTSQTFLKAFKALERFNPSGGSFQAWLYQIARHTVIDHFRLSRPQQPIQDAWDLASNEDIPTDTDTRLRIEKVKAALQQLPSQHRELIIMRLWQGLSFAEIAEILRKSEQSCKMQFSRTIRKFRAEQLAALLLFLSRIV